MYQHLAISSLYDIMTGSYSVAKHINDSGYDYENREWCGIRSIHVPDIIRDLSKEYVKVKYACDLNHDDGYIKFSYNLILDNSDMNNAWSLKVFKLYDLDGPRRS